MKKTILLLLLLITACAKTQQPEIQEPKTEIEIREQPLQPNITIRQHGFEVNFTGPELKEFNREPNFMFNFQSKDLLNRNYVRNPNRWNLYIYYVAKNYTKVPLCFIDKLDENLWSNTFCIEQNSLPNYLYNRELFLIYTNYTSDYFQEKTIRRIRNIKDSIVFNLTLNK